MSNISTVIDALRARIPTLSGFTTKTEIPNAYSLKDNPLPLMENGWGLKYGAASPSSVDEYCRFSESRTISVVLTSLVFRTEDDAATYASACKALLESALILKKDISGPSQFNNESYVLKVDFISDSGLSFVSDDKFTLLYVETNFAVDINESW